MGSTPSKPVEKPKVAKPAIPSMQHITPEIAAQLATSPPVGPHNFGAFSVSAPSAMGTPGAAHPNLMQTVAASGITGAFEAAKATGGPRAKLAAGLAGAVVGAIQAHVEPEVKHAIKKL